MAAPTYFPPQPIHKQIIQDGRFVKDPNSDHIPPEIFIDGGVFANDPELVALWAIRIQWKKLVNYHLLSIGTGCYNAELSPST
jgi:patatin-like phospholipase/acyl hydrolase